MGPEDGFDPTERSRAAARRVAELDERLIRLRAGESSTTHDVEQAQQAAGQQLIRDQDAHRSSAQAHREAAASHRSAADLLLAAGQPDRAAEHRRLAETNEEAARRALAAIETTGTGAIETSGTG